LFSPVRWWTNRQLPAIFCWNIFSGHGIEIFQCCTLVSTHTRVAFSALRAASPRCAHKKLRNLNKANKICMQDLGRYGVGNCGLHHIIQIAILPVSSKVI
jgi:hypothetical protein